MTDLTLLVAGDLHLGRSSSRIDRSSTGIGPDGVGRDLDATAAGAWPRLVDEAIRIEADLLCLTGDVADEENRYWQAIGPLADGIERLHAAGIPVVAVSGNHDHDVLPRLARQVSSRKLRLLGAGGRWERFTLERDGTPLLHVDGWSFPRATVARSPVDDYRPDPGGGAPVLAMVHGDLDVPTSPYAPLRRGDLRARPVLGWLLGHIHAPLVEQPASGPFIVYPGSPQALDPGEPGMHGALRLELGPGGAIRELRPVPLSTVRYDRLDVDVTGVEDEVAFDRRVREAIEGHAASIVEAGAGPLACVALRLAVHGRSAFAPRVEAELAHLARDAVFRFPEFVVVVERARADVRPDLDLEALGRASTPAGMLARVLLDLDRTGADDPLDGDAKALVQAVDRQVGAHRRGTSYQRLDAGDLDPAPAELRALAREQASRLLVDLVEQST